MFTLNVPVALQDLFPKCGKPSHKVVDVITTESSNSGLLVIEVDCKEIPLRVTRFDSDSTMVLNDLVDGIGKYVVVKHIHGSIYMIEAIVESADVITKPTVEAVVAPTPTDRTKTAGSPNAVKGCPFRNKSFV